MLGSVFHQLDAESINDRIEKRINKYFFVSANAGTLFTCIDFRTDKIEWNTRNNENERKRERRGFRVKR